MEMGKNIYFFHSNESVIELTEFLEMMARMSSSEEEEFREAFRVFDKDGNGTISPEELKSVLKQLGETLSDKEIGKLN
jgi:calmodulin